MDLFSTRAHLGSSRGVDCLGGFLVDCSKQTTATKDAAKEFSETSKCRGDASEKVFPGRNGGAGISISTKCFTKQLRKSTSVSKLSLEVWVEVFTNNLKI